MQVSIKEVGIREGIQISKLNPTTTTKLDLLFSLADLNFETIEATSIVRPDLVPNHSDSSEILSELSNLSNPEKFTALYLNKRGFEILAKSKLRLEPWIHTAIEEDFLIKNVGRNFSKEKDYFAEMSLIFKDYGLPFVNIMLSTSFGLKTPVSFKQFKKRLDSVIKQIPLNIGRVVLADTSGIALPKQVRKFLRKLKTEFENVGVHFHDTQGFGLINCLTALETGVSYFETSICGLGGCPFVPNASGNVATEELIVLLEDEGIKTGFSIEKLREVSRKIYGLFRSECHSKLAKKWFLESS